MSPAGDGRLTFFLAAFAALSGPVSRVYYDKKNAEGRKQYTAGICLTLR